MTKSISVLGVDPSLSNFGIAKGQLDLETDKFSLERLELVETSPSSNKTVRKSSQDYDRCLTLATALFRYEKDVHVIFVEMPIGSQSARAMASYGMCIGIIAGIRDVPVIQVSPAEVKLAAVGSKVASKEDMIEWAYSKYTHDDWIVGRGGKPAKKNEHLADAVATIEAGVKSTHYIAAKSVLKALYQ